jgi:hypothetical protein
MMAHDILNWKPAHKFNLSGAQLSVMSQTVTYQSIQEGTQPTQRKHTVINLNITRYAVKMVTGHLPTDATIWHSIRSKDITRTIRVFFCIKPTNVVITGSKYQTLNTRATALTVVWRTPWLIS